MVNFGRGVQVHSELQKHANYAEERLQQGIRRLNRRFWWAVGAFGLFASLAITAVAAGLFSSGGWALLVSIIGAAVVFETNRTRTDQLHAQLGQLQANPASYFGKPAEGRYGPANGEDRLPAMKVFYPSCQDLRDKCITELEGVAEAILAISEERRQPAIDYYFDTERAMFGALITLYHNTDWRHRLNEYRELLDKEVYQRYYTESARRQQRAQQELERLLEEAGPTLDNLVCSVEYFSEEMYGRFDVAAKTRRRQAANKLLRELSAADLPS